VERPQSGAAGNARAESFDALVTARCPGCPAGCSRCLTLCGSPARPRSGRGRCNRSLSGPALPIRQMSIRERTRFDYFNSLPAVYRKQVLIS
jgi:hypothetical protein